MPYWHTLTAEQALAELGSAAKGLDDDAAKNRLREYGPNELAERGGRGVWRIVVSQISSVLIVLLIAAALVSAALGDWPDAAAIMTIVVLNAALGARQEYGAEQAMAALKKLSAPRVKLRRSGHVIEAEAAACPLRRHHADRRRLRDHGRRETRRDGELAGRPSDIDRRVGTGREGRLGELRARFQSSGAPQHGFSWYSRGPRQSRGGCNGNRHAHRVRAHRGTDPDGRSGTDSAAETARSSRAACW